MNKFYSFIISCFLLIVSAYGQLSPNNYWVKLDSISGLLSNTINSIQAENKSNIWIGTERGLSHFDGTTITNYTVANSALNNNNILDIALANNRVWLRTDSGISSFGGGVFTNYTYGRELLNSPITGMSVTLTDTLWLGTVNGLSKYDGTAFMHDSSKVASTIASDSLGRIYIVNTDRRGDAYMEIYDSSKWTSNLLFRRSRSIWELKRTISSELLLIQQGEGVIYKVSHPNTLDKLEFDHSSNNLFRSNIEIEIDGNTSWVSVGSPSDLISRTEDSVLAPLSINEIINNVSSVSIFDNIIFIGTDKGAFYTDKSLQSVKDEGEIMELNSIRTLVYPTRSLFTNLSRSDYNFEFRKNTDNHGIYTTGLVVIAKEKNGSNTIVTPKQPFDVNYASGPVNSTGGLGEAYIFHISKAEIDSHITKYQQTAYTAPKGILDWPATGNVSLGMASDLAPFIDVNADGCYNPLDGDYPAIKGDEAIYWINHPLKDESSESLNFEYHWMLYAYDEPSDSALNQSLFLEHTIINRTTVEYDSIKLGLYVDYDLGNLFDDFIGSDSLNNIMYAYNGDSNDEPFGGRTNYGTNPPAVGVKYLSDSMDMAMYYVIGSGNNGDPTTTSNWVNYLNGKWKNGNSITYDGNGHNVGTTNIPTKYMFTGNPGTNQGWTEENLNNPPGDRRMLSSIPYFSLDSGERKTISMVFGYAEKNKATTSVGETVPDLIGLLNKAKESWDTLQLSGTSLTSKTNCLSTAIDEVIMSEETFVKLYPIPASNELHVRSSKKMQLLELYDVKGAKQLSSNVNSYSYKIEVSQYAKGFYFIRIQYENGQWENRKVILGD